MPNPSSMHTVLRLALVGFIACAIASAATSFILAAEHAELLKAHTSITPDELKSHAQVLADDTLEGREAGSRGSQAAANYIIAALTKQGLQPAGDGKTFFQSFWGTSRNILAILPGSDPTLKQEYIVIGAHYDHVGYGRSNNSYGPLGYIHNGADDNASGVAGLLEIIDGIKKLEVAPRRSILFCFWDAEEAGLLGSKHWLGRPTISTDAIKLYINLDMIGRLKNSKVEVYGTRTALGLRNLVSRCNADTKLDLDFTWKLKEDSDHYPFFARSIPILMFHTGLHEDYHRPSDDIEKLDSAGMQRVAQLTLATLLQLADQEKLSPFRGESRQETPAHRTAFEQPSTPFAPRFGMPWQLITKNPEDTTPGLTLQMLRPTPGSATEAAGIRAGDLIISFEAEPIESEDALRLAMLAADGPRTFGIIRLGEKEPKPIAITPRGNPIRMGLSFRKDAGDPSSMFVAQVATFSAADLAGIKIGDRVTLINKQAFASEEEFTKLMAQPQQTLEFQLERRGTFHDAILQLPPAPQPSN